MTLNGHSALKSGPSSASNGLAFWLSEKTIRKFVVCVAHAGTAAAAAASALVNILIKH